MMLTPSSLAASIKPLSSWSVNQGEYSICRASILATTVRVSRCHLNRHLEYAKLTGTSLSEGSHTTFAKTDVLAFASLSQTIERCDRFLKRSVGIDTVKVVEVGVRPKSLLCTFNVVFDVGGLVGDNTEAFSSRFHALRFASQLLFGIVVLRDSTYVETALGGHKNLVTSVVLLQEIAQQLLIMTLAIHNSRIPESAS